MEMVNIVGHMDDVNEVAKRIILSSSVHMTSAITEIKDNDFPILKAKDNMDALIDYYYIKQYTSEANLSEIEKKVDAIYEMFGNSKKVNTKYINEDYSFTEDVKKLNELYELVKESYSHLTELNDKYNNMIELKEYLSYIKDIDVDLSELLDMKYIDVKIGTLSSYDMDKLRKNYENISALVFKIYHDKNYAVVMLFIPKTVEEEMQRVLGSLNFNEFKIAAKFEGTPANWIDSIEKSVDSIRQETDNIKSKLKDLEENNKDEIEKYYSRLMMEYKIEELKSNIACTDEFFYLTGWIPSYKKGELSKYLGEFESKLILIYKDVDEVSEGVTPPTCMKNNYLLKPFETLVKLYGTPSYNEVDPTSFVGLTYMFLFGAMFGDVGQGLVFFILGEILSRVKKRTAFGGLLSRLGICSTVFGFIYGSFFGFEDVLKYKGFKPIHPMANINFLLGAAVVVGVLMLTVGYFYNFVNSYKTKDIENGVFSKNGVVGLVFYWGLLYAIYAGVKGIKTFMPLSAIVLVLVLLLIVMLLKEPISNLIKGKRPLYNESKSDYYIEGGFGVIETLLSLFSNTVSFIRVGAFAINHVGLFIAFDTLAKMMKSGAGGAVVIVLGNLVIIGLEGLIVFIQGLRLEYYELFSKYFSGAGYEYKPIAL